MNIVFLVLGFAGLLGCYDIARRMSWKTRHGMRAAIILIGAGCVLAMLSEYQWGLLAMLIGCGLYRFFDKREEGWSRGRADPGDSSAVATQPAEWGQRPSDPVASRNNVLGGGLHLASVRQDPVRRRA